MTKTALALITGVALVLAGPVRAQPAFPDRPLRLIVGFTAGGGTDTLGRLVGQELGKALHQPVIIENRPGAGGEIAAQTTAKATPDGYTLWLGTNGPLTISPAVHPDLPYAALADFEPIAMVAQSPMLLVVSATGKARNLRELIDYAKANPGKLTFASTGVGAVPHLSAEMFVQMAGVTALHVPYKGAAQAFPDIISGQVDFFFSSVSSALPLMKAGKIRPIGITSAERSTLAPSVPSIANAVPGYSATIWYGVFAPKGLPPEVVATLRKAMAEALLAPEMEKTLVDQGFETFNLSGEQIRGLITAESNKWRQTVIKSNLKF